jgi:hypothetical protein
MTLAQLLDDLKTSYIISLTEKRQTVARLIETRQLTALEDEFHKMKGTGKTYGLPEVSLLGEAMEMICHHQQEPLADSLAKSLAVLDWIQSRRGEGKEPDPAECRDLQTLFDRRKQLP